ncbi:uncharacterized protein LOC132795059 isoform X3 [Drosophila nasuta]|uniref:uncharacterized protein LOC132795059 isoform X3 n=1 Tax=Drosophila nasuta TaxID=42062 RepID=UPI00295F3ACD|nr:uncharacterized protein LOC132795059 isoform X3 [Drosophila nasuta]
MAHCKCKWPTSAPLSPPALIVTTIIIMIASKVSAKTKRAKTSVTSNIMLLKKANYTIDDRCKYLMLSSKIWLGVELTLQ